MDVEIQEIISELNTPQKYSLLLLMADNYEPIPGNLWLQKELFVLSRNLEDLNTGSDFVPYFLGPYSEIADEGIELLELEGVIERDKHKIILTDFGKDVAVSLSKDQSKDTLDMITDFKGFLNDLNSDELLAFVYFTYGMTKESKELKNLLPNRHKIALRLYKKDKVSLEKAAQIAGKDLESFLDFANQVTG